MPTNATSTKAQTTAASDQDATAGQTASQTDIEAQVAQIKTDVAALTRMLTGLAGDTARSTKEAALNEVSDLLDRSRGQAMAAKRSVGRKAESLEQYIEENPLQSALFALGAGILVGWISRR